MGRYFVYVLGGVYGDVLITVLVAEHATMAQVLCDRLAETYPADTYVIGYGTGAEIGKYFYNFCEFGGAQQ